MNFLKKVQNLSEAKKRIVLWTMIVILFLFLSFWYFQITRKVMESANTKKFLEEELKIPKLRGEIQKAWQKVKPGEEELKKIKNSIEELLQESKKEIEKYSEIEGEKKE